MRPLLLKIQGFMAYKQPVEIDFSKMNVFVLTGQTGAGKSSLLDAICFALYGETPRIGPKEIKKLIYQDVENPRQQAQVSFSFRHQGKDYRITRQISPSTHRVELETRKDADADWEKHSTGLVSEFKNMIPKLLGLDFKAFSRVLLLPQGGFDQFLKQDGPDYRRKVLMSLAQLDVYEKIQQEADRHRKELNQELTRLEGEMGGISEVSPEAVTQLENQLLVNRQQLASQTQACREAEQALRSAEVLWQLLQSLAKNQAEQEELEARHGEIENLKANLEQGRRLLQLAPELNFLAQGEQKLAKLSRQLEALKQQQSELEQLQTKLDEQESSLQEELAQQPAWESERERLRELKPEVEKAEQLQAQLKHLHDQTSHREKLIQAARQRIQLAEAGQLDIAREQEALEQQRQPLAFDPERLDLLQDVLPELKQLQTVEQPALLETEQRLLQHAQMLETSQLRQKTLHQQFEMAQQAFQQAETELQAIESVLRTLELQQQAVALRKALGPGDACPVCEQTVHVLPQALDSGELASQAKRVQAERKQLKELEKQVQQSLREQAEGQAEWGSLNARSKDLETARQELSQRCAEQSQRLMAKLGVSDLPEWQMFRQEIDQLKLNAKALQDLEKRSAELKQRMQQHHQDLEMGKQGLVLHQQELETRKAELTNIEQASQACEQKLQVALNVSQDYTKALLTLLDVLQDKLKKLAERQRLHLQAADELKQKQTRLESELRLTDESVTTQQSENQDQTFKLNAHMQALGYSSLNSAREAMPSEVELKHRESLIQEHDRQTQSVLREKIRLQEQIEGRSLTQDELSAQQARVDDIQTEVQTLSREVGVQENQLKTLQSQLERSRELQLKRGTLKHQLGIYDRIYEDLGSRKLPDFLAKRIMERVILSGSEELHTLSNERYRFQLDENEELVILDAWNANEPRSVKTLSGGESFLASLALALALNQYLSSGIQLDSLFIDEGFGTLDPETLEMAAEVIEKLQQGGKCIGVITHIPELAERFEYQLKVIKLQEGSVVKQA